jgi:hypothetical protein
MSNKNKKNYKKIYLNGECLIDFTKQTINADTIASGNLFFDAEGKLVEGHDDSIAMLNAYMGGYEYISNQIINYDKLGIRTQQIDQISPYLSSNMSSMFPFATYWKVSDQLSTVYSLGSYDYLEYVGGIYLPSQKNASSNIYKNLLGYAEGTQNKSATIIYCEDDISEYVPDNLKPCFIFNCSKIKTTEDKLFDYVISNNKVYILGMDYRKLGPYLTRNETTSAYTYKFPDTIEDKPVVGLSGHLFGYPYYNCQYISGLDEFYHSFDKIELPCNLEILGGSCFYDLRYAAENGINLTLPSSLKALLGSTRADSWTSSNSFCGGRFDLSSNMVDGKLVIPDLDYCSGSLYSLIYNSNISLDENDSYIASPTNQYTYYFSSNTESSNLVIEEGCKHVLGIPSSVTAITLPSTLKSLPSLQSRSSLTSLSLNFTDLTIINTIPSSFCYQCSNLTAINVPEGITKINRDAFGYCSKLADITLPSTLTYVDYDAFYEGYNASNLGKIIRIKATTPPQLYSSSSLVYNKNNLSKIIVPQGCLDKYKNASNWSTFATKMEESTEW